MNTCETCRFFARHHVHAYGRCESPKIDNDKYEGNDGVNTTGIDVMLLVGESFGCVHHEPKPAEPPRFDMAAAISAEAAE